MPDIAGWFRDRAVRKVAKHGLPVAIGKGLASLSGMVTLAVMTRHLGVTVFGVYAVFRSIATIVDTYTSFNTWQAIVRYGAQAVADGRPDEVRRIIKFAFTFDATTAVLGGAIVVVVAFAVPGWDAEKSVLCALYGLTLVTKVAGTSDGIYRFCDAYRVQAIIGVLGAVVTTIAAVVSVALDASFAGCVVALVFAEALSNLALTIGSFVVARRAGYGGWLRVPVAGVRRAHPGILRFLLATNAQLTVRTSQNELDIPVIAAVLGDGPTGLFRVVKQIGTIPGKVFMPFELVVFTELARAAAARDYRGFRRLLTRTVALFGGGAFLVWIAIAIGASYVVRLIAGADFIAAAEPLRWYLLAMVLQMALAPILRAMIALGRPGTLFVFDSISLVVVIGGVVAGALLYGLVGVALAIVLHKIVQLAWSTAWVLRHLHHLERAQMAI